MSIAALGLNAILMVLLLAALAFGWRLERRLRALKDSHDSFARAVADLDAAAARAEQGLADLRAATDEAAETLAERIAAARTLATRLEGAAARADRPREAADRAPAAQPAPVAAPDRREQSVEHSVVQSRLPAVTPRSRARVDDDLFEPDAEGARLRAIVGGRR
ncbi:MAG: DUF6468 domain-containing protein [Pseudomonadota bacterium]